MKPRYYIEQARAGHWNIIDRKRMVAVGNRMDPAVAQQAADARNAKLEEAA